MQPGTPGALGLAALALLLAAPAADAQVAPTVSLAADTTQFTLDPGQSAAATLTVQSQSTLGGTVQLALEGPVPPWTATLSPSQVPAGGTAQATVTFRAPPDRTVTAPAQWTVTATLTTATGTATDSAAFQAQLTAPPPPPPGFPWVPVLAGLALVVALVAGAAYIQRRESGIEVHLAQDTAEAWPGMNALVSVEVRNASGRPRVAEVLTRGTPLGWAVGTNENSFHLDPGEARTLWLSVRPTLDARAGPTTLVVSAKPAEARRARSGASLQVNVLGRSTEGPAPPAGGPRAAPEDHDGSEATAIPGPERASPPS